MDIKKHYKQLYEKYGDSVSAVQYSDSKSQTRRFEILSEISHQLTSVVDLGCGLGDMYAFLSSKEKEIEYLGLDFVDEFINKAKEKYISNDKVKFEIFDITKQKIAVSYDYIFLSGVFNNPMKDNWGFMKETLKKMYFACGKGIAFNAMSTYVDYQDKDLYYVDPCKVFDFCKKELGTKIVLRNDYLVKENSIPFEFAMYVYK